METHFYEVSFANPHDTERQEIWVEATSEVEALKLAVDYLDLLPEDWEDAIIRSLPWAKTGVARAIAVRWIKLDHSALS